MAAENLYQMFTRMGGAGFFVKRDSWRILVPARG
jgi:hypothetical protein